MSIEIIGAGLAGLLAGNLLRHHDPTILEKQPTLPNNHSAVLRFRSSIIGDVTNIPFRKVTLLKGVVPWRNSIADALAYSFKCTGSYRSDRSISSGVTNAERWIAPPDLISRLAMDCKIAFSRELQLGTIADWLPRISTIPMPILMELLGYPHRDKAHFNSVPGISIRCTIEDCDAYISLLVPDPKEIMSRISITGNELIIEVPGIKSEAELEDLGVIVDDLIINVATLLGIDADKIDQKEMRPQTYFKILPIDEELRRSFMFWATDQWRIFSLGRYATWRPSLVLDDLVKDIRLIDGWISKRDNYAVARHR